jgi:hypothetical protein
MAMGESKLGQFDPRHLNYGNESPEQEAMPPHHPIDPTITSTELISLHPGALYYPYITYICFANEIFEK